MHRFNRRLTIVIPAGLQAKANALAAEIDQGGAGHLTFTVPLYPRGGPQTQPVAYWCGWQCTTEQHAALLARFGGETPGRPGRVFDGFAVGPEAVLQAMGLERTKGPMGTEAYPPSAAELGGVGLTTAFLPKRGRRAWWLLIPAGLLAAGAAAAGLGGVEWIEQFLKFLGLT